MSEPRRRVQIRWTSTAKELLKSLPEKVCEGLLNKADELYECSDPKRAHKPLTGSLQGYYRITYSRYRAIYTVEEAEVANGETVINITIIFVAAGKRQERSKRDVYKVAEKIVELGLIDLEGEGER